jgi:hypothetical protein
MNTPLPAEFLGLGRRFREQIADADDLSVRTIGQLFAPLARRADRCAMPRPEMLQDTVRHWRRAMPGAGLIDSKIELSRRELHIREVRVGATRDDVTNEPMIAILLIELDVAPGICRVTAEPAAVLSLHALGRWYQRALDTSVTALLAGLGRLASAYAGILDESGETGHPGFLCSTAGGQWAGSVTRRFSEVTGRREAVLDIRTFLPAHAMESAAVWPGQNRAYRDRIAARSAVHRERCVETV